MIALQGLLLINVCGTVFTTPHARTRTHAQPIPVLYSIVQYDGTVTSSKGRDCL